MRRVWYGVVIFGLVVCNASTPVLAQPAQKAEAARHHSRGLSLVKSHAYGEAIAEFNQAYDLGRDFAVLYDIGQAYISIDQPVFAVDTLRKYLSQGGNRVPAARRKVVEAEVSKQEGRIATLLVRPNVTGATIRLDGIEVGTAPMSVDLRINAGAHLIAVVAEGYRPWEQPVDLVGGEQKILDVRLEASAPPAVPPPSAAAASATSSAGAVAAPIPVAAVAQPTPPASPPMSTERKVAFGLAGLGVAALTMGGVYGMRALSKRHDSDTFCPQNQCTQAGVDLNNQAKTAARIADVAIGVGLASAAVATYLFVRSPKYQTVAESPRNDGVRLHADIAPGRTGVVLRGAW
jgi:hypothetical protein